MREQLRGLARRVVHLGRRTASLSRFAARHLGDGRLRFQTLAVRELLSVREPEPAESDGFRVCRNVRVSSSRYLVTDGHSFFVSDASEPRWPKPFASLLPHVTQIGLAAPEAVFGFLWLRKDNYYHALKDVFFQIHLLRSSGRRLPVLFTGDLNAYQRELWAMVAGDLPLVQIPAEGVALLAERYETFEPRAWDVLSPIPDSRRLESWREYLSHLRTASASAKPPLGGAWPDKILAVRKGVGRGLARSAEVEEVFRSFGFTPILFENHSVAQQIQLATQARVLAGPHGANLANSVFCRSGSELLEMLPSDFQDDCYERLAALQGVRYSKLLGGPVTARGFEVDLSALREALQALERRLSTA